MKNRIIIGVDGGGTKTDAWAVGLNGKVLGKGKAGPSNLRNSGIENSALVVAKAIKSSVSKIKQKEIVSMFIGLAAVEEEYKERKNEIKKELFKHGKMFSEIENKITIGGDQEIAFRSGTDEKEGVVVIAGTGCVARGWKERKTVKSSGWGWLADEGSACWVGQQLYQKILKEMDGRDKRSSLVEFSAKRVGFKNAEELNKKVYQNHPSKTLSQLSLAADLAAEKGNKEAIKIFQKSGEELAFSALTVIKRLSFKKNFPLVLVGGMFKSRILINTFKKQIKNNNLKAKILISSNPPVYGAIKIAKEKYEKS